jgi:hypothetical protein
MEMIKRWFRKLFKVRCTVCQSLEGEVGWVIDPQYPPNHPEARYIPCPHCYK